MADASCSFEPLTVHFRNGKLDAMIGQVVSHYRILARLGEGGMGSVYVAEDLHLGRRVAVKFPMTKPGEHHYRARFLREARAASSLNHPNIAAIYDYGETSEGQPFIVMELINGKTLSSLIDDGKLTLTRAVEILEDLAHALSEAHAHGVIHRDVKPSNVIINDRGEVKVLDFGLAKHLNLENFDQADPDARTLLATHTQSGAVVGTPLYLSPEQAMGTDVDARSDLFAAGTVLYESIAGKPPFTGKGMIEIAAQVIHVHPPPPSAFNPRVPPELDRISLKALAKRPEERYQSADELVADLETVHSNLRERGVDQTLTRRIPIAHETARTSALATFSEMISRPRMSLGWLLISVVVLGAVVWGIKTLWRPKLQPPSAEAQKWYDQGTNALREGTYYKASKAFEEALKIDDNFALAHARLAEAWTELDSDDKAKDEIIRANSLVPDRSILPPLDALYLKAITDTVSRDFPSAIKGVNEIVQLVPAPEKPTAYLDLGRAYERNEDRDNAINSYAKASELDSQYAAAFMRLGILYGRKRDLPGAETAFKRSEEIYRATSNYEGVAEVLYQRGVVYNKGDRLAEARSQFEEALEISRTTSNIAQQIKSKLQLSIVLRTAGDSAKAEQYTTDVIELARAHGLENLFNSGLIDLGYLYLLRGDYDEAEKYFKQAVDHAQRIKARRNEARALLSLGSLSMQRTKADEAIGYVQRALRFYQEGGYRTETNQALILLGRANRQQGNYEAALKAFEQQLQLAQQAGDKLQEALSNEGLGIVFSRLERYPEALAHFEGSQNNFKSLGSKQGITNSSINIASTLWTLGRYTQARAMLDEVAKTESRADGDKSLVISSISELAEAALSQRDFSEVKTKSKNTIDLAGSQYPSTVLRAKRTLGVANGLSGAAAKGRDLCKEALDLAEKINDPWVLSKTRLAYAETLLESGDTQNALANARSAEESFVRSGQQESLWRAELISARASNRARDEAKSRDYAARSLDSFNRLEQKWGTKEYQDYLTRPDVKYYRNQLDQLLANKTRLQP
jgi:serine/threonine protein kinase